MSKIAYVDLRRDDGTPLRLTSSEVMRAYWDLIALRCAAFVRLTAKKKEQNGQSK